MYLDRVDIEAQAVSLYCAMVSGEWHRVADATDEMRRIPYDKTMIDENVVNLLYEKLAWQGFFSANGILPLTLYYEAFAQNIELYVKRVAAFFGGVSHPETFAMPDQRKATLNAYASILKRYKEARRGPQAGQYDV